MPRPKQPRRFVLVYHEKPFTYNEIRRWHWSKIAKATKEWREAFCVLAREAKIPNMECIRVQATQYIMPKGGWTDTMAAAPAIKAGIDGLVDAGVIVDDDRMHLTRIDCLTPLAMPESWKRPGLKGALELVIEEVTK